MSYEIKINEDQAGIEILSRDGNNIEVQIDDRKYKLDIVEVEKGVYSILLDGRSYTVELAPIDNKKYTVNTLYDSFEIEVIDAESKYMNSRKKDDGADASFISTPMPGKVVKIFVKEGDEVKGGDTVIIVSAMKMESEYKVVSDRIIKKVLVSEGDTIEGNQPLILLE
jgi:biotin carboxyl carrier protein